MNKFYTDILELEDVLNKLKSWENGLDYRQRNVPALPSFVPPFAMKCTSHCQPVYHLLTSV